MAAGTGVLGLMLAAAILTGCTTGGAGSGGEPSATPAPSPSIADGVGLEILQSRTDYAVRGLQLSISNPGDEAFSVESARFESPQFDAPVIWTPGANGPVEVPAGLTRHLPVSLAGAVCPAPAGMSADATLTVTVIDASGARREVSGAPADPFGVLPRIAAEDCFGDDVAAVASLAIESVSIEGSGADAVARITIGIDPREGAGELTIDEVRFTILLAPDGVSATGEASQDWPVGLAVVGGDQPGTIVLNAVPARCDPHAVAEDKRGTVLPVGITLASGAEGTIYLDPGVEARETLYDFIAERCGFAAE
ncbi:hypothetical protein N1031_11145 [Herbiconiux moechotypicola]|uniref:Lipoprotein n=1 Tax=Herbiconiux moechotypicola TaxID=637393 RepID=A0ABP5QIC5_9MICO|nr:hypothetical protein [Herbiconiux moechotypicola]MCS5730317.1 hypothetical protein [Herbiconiux moechotypicola]